ncbi:MAG: STAS domain-containing protein [Methylococcales bacterium]|nr:STAS domain-containing protein [Methylococcales bacterium]
MPKKKEQGNHLAIEGEFTIYTVGELKEQILGALLANDEFEMDLSAVEEFDAAGLQLLIMTKKGASALNRKFRLTGCSAAVLSLLDLSGLASFFGDSLTYAKSKEAIA